MTNKITNTSHDSAGYINGFTIETVSPFGQVQLLDVDMVGATVKMILQNAINDATDVTYTFTGEWDYDKAWMDLVEPALADIEPAPVVKTGLCLRSYLAQQANPPKFKLRPV